MILSSTRRYSRVKRFAALASAILHLALAVGATHDVEVHRLEAAARLPQAYHHHQFSLVERGPDVRPSMVDECLACHLSRLVPKIVTSGIVPESIPQNLARFADPSRVASNRIAPSPRVTRGPPSPSA